MIRKGNPRRRVLGWNLSAGLTVVLVVGLIAPSLASEKQQAEEEKRRILQRSPREYHPKPPLSVPEKEARNQLERENTSGPARTPGPADEQGEGAILPAAREDSRQSLIDSHDWEGHFQNAGEIKGNLQLALGASDETYRHGARSYLYLGLRNLDPARRTLEQMPACGSLARAETLVLRVVSDAGTEFVLRNRFRDTMDIHPHPPLVVEGGADLVDLLDFSEFVMSSGDLFDLVQVSKRLTVTVEAPSTGLTSNAQTFNLE